jgi:hypothetical protein
MPILNKNVNAATIAEMMQPKTRRNENAGIRAATRAAYDGIITEATVEMAGVLQLEETENTQLVKLQIESAAKRAGMGVTFGRRDKHNQLPFILKVAEDVADAVKPAKPAKARKS